MDLLTLAMAKNDSSSVSKNQFHKAFSTDSASGSIVSFLDGADGLSAKTAKIMISPKQSGSGTPAPGNIRTITGWTGLSLKRTGKNLLPNKKYQRNTTQVVLGGESVDEAYIYLRAGTYSLSVVNNVDAGCYYHNSDESGNHYIGTAISSFTLDKDGLYYFYAYKSTGISSSDITSWQLEANPRATQYEEYHGSTDTISWQTEAGTVYGGTLDITIGRLIVDRQYLAISSQNTIYYRGNGSTAYIEIDIPVETNSNYNDIICSHFESANIVEGGTTQGIGCNGSKLYIRNSLFSSKADFTAWLDEQKNAGTPLQVTVICTTPQPYNIAPREVITFLGANTIWSDAGNTFIEYYADQSKYIDKEITAANNMIAEIESTNRATKNYSIGDLFIVGNTLYKVTANIANGGSIIPGTNVTETTIAEQIILLANA